MVRIGSKGVASASIQQEQYAVRLVAAIGRVRLCDRQHSVSVRELCVMSSDSSQSRTWSQSIVDKLRDDFVTLEDGYKYYWPHGEHRGAMSAELLRLIADELDAANAAWDAIVQECPVLSETIETPFAACS